MLKNTLLLFGLSICSLNVSAALTETFDQTGNSMSLSAFSNIYTVGGGTYLRDSLSGVSGVPNNSPSLPVNVGGDKELRYVEDLSINIAATTGYAVTHETFNNATIDAYIGINSTVGPAYAVGGVMLNVSGTSIPTINGYGATIQVWESDPTQAILGFRKVENGIGTGISYSGFQLFDVDLANENYHIEFGVNNGELSASLWRVLMQGDSLVEQPIDLLTYSGIQNTVTVTDAVPMIINPDFDPENYDPNDPNNQPLIPDPTHEIFSSGRAGMSAFARNGSEVYFDNVSVSTVPLPAAVWLFGSGLIGLIGFASRKQV